MRNKVNLEQLKKEIRNLHYWQPLFKLLREELKNLGYWKDKPRGNPQKGFRMGWGKHAKN